MILYIILFSLIQGFTEFLPISSQGHLIVFNSFFEFKPTDIINLTVVAHFGSLFAILIYHNTICVKLFLSISNIFRSDIDQNVTLLKNIFFSSLPIFLIAYLFSFFYDLNFLTNLKLIGYTTLSFGIILYIFDRSCLRIKTIESLPTKSAFFIGLIQSLAIIPGCSRSGLVITAMRFLGYTRVESAIYSNLLSIPAISGAMVFLIYKNFTENILSDLFNITSIVIFFLSFFFSIIFIHFLITWVRKSSFAIFLIYRIIFGLLLLTYVYLQPEIL